MVLFLLYFPIKVAGGHSLSSRGKSPAAGLNDNPAVLVFHNKILIMTDDWGRVSLRNQNYNNYDQDNYENYITCGLSWKKRGEKIKGDL